MCSKWGYAYAGVQESHECFCGNQRPSSEHRVNDDLCNHKCSGDKEEFCGGHLAINVLETAVKPNMVNHYQASNAEPNKGDHDDTSTNDIRIVYVLTVNGRAVRQVKRLIKQLYDGRNYFYIHVDSRQDYLYRELKPLEAIFPNNIHVTPRRWAPIWGGASLLSVLLGCMSDLLHNLTDWKWDFFINLSETDYPLKSASALTKFLMKNPGRNFIKSHGFELDQFIKKQGLSWTFLECEFRMWRIGRRMLPMGIDFDGGSDYVCFNREFVQFLIDSSGTDPLLIGLKPIFQNSIMTTESYFHTVLRNSKFCPSYVNNDLHLVNWHSDRSCNCEQTKSTADWCGCRPTALLPQDMDRINNTLKGDVFFARKLVPSISLSILNTIDNWIVDNDIQLQMTAGSDSYITPSPSRYMYWENIYHHTDSSPPYDSAVLELANMLSRYVVVHSLQSTDFAFVRVEEVTSYHVKDQLAGIVISFTAEHPAEGFSHYEFLVKIRKDFSQTAIKFRSGSFAMGTQFDPRELLFRNFFNALGTRSQLEFNYSFAKPTLLDCHPVEERVLLENGGG